MKPIDIVLAGLTKVRRRLPGQWSACCPAHDDKSPSLSVRETPDGAVLLYCFAGCEVADIVAALGLRVDDLYSPRERPLDTPARLARLLTPSQALDLMRELITFVAVIAANIGHKVDTTDADRTLCLKAAGKLNWLHDECTGGRYVA